jgi:hypothetical protein
MGAGTRVPGLTNFSLASIDPSRSSHDMSILSWYDAMETRFHREVPAGRESFTRTLYAAKLSKGVTATDIETYHQQV